MRIHVQDETGQLHRQKARHDEVKASIRTSVKTAAESDWGGNVHFSNIPVSGGHENICGQVFPTGDQKEYFGRLGRSNLPNSFAYVFRGGAYVYRWPVAKS
jgi:hypothetical protein